MSRGILDTIKLDVELSGLEPGTDAYDREVRLRQVQACQELRHLSGCGDCPYQGECNLFRAYYMDLKRASGA